MAMWAAAKTGSRQLLFPQPDMGGRNAQCARSHLSQFGLPAVRSKLRANLERHVRSLPAHRARSARVGGRISRQLRPGGLRSAALPRKAVDAEPIGQGGSTSTLIKAHLDKVHLVRLTQHPSRSSCRPLVSGSSAYPEARASPRLAVSPPQTLAPSFPCCASCLWRTVQYLDSPATAQGGFAYVRPRATEVARRNWYRKYRRMDA